MIHAMVVPTHVLISWHCQTCGFSHRSNAQGSRCPTCADNVAALRRTRVERLSALRDLIRPPSPMLVARSA